MDQFAKEIIEESLGVQRLKRIPIHTLEKTIDNWMECMNGIHSKETAAYIASKIKEAEAILQDRKRANPGGD